MNLKKSNKWSWILVLTSLNLLLLFVCYWNYQEYCKAKNQLSNELHHELSSAYNEVRDRYLKDDITVFLQTLPSSNKTKFEFDSLSFDYSFSTQKSDSNKIIRFDHTTSLAQSINSSDSVYKSIIEKYAHKDSIIATHIVNPTQIQLQLSHSDKESLYNKLCDSIFNQEKNLISQDSTRTIDILPEIFFVSEKREKETYENFDKRLIQNGLPTEYQIVNPSNIEDHEFKIVYESSSFDNRKWIIASKSYGIYLFKWILPNILFSIFLICIVGLAFWTLMYNWNQQQELVKTKNEFINNMTHELKTPLATIGVALEAITNFDPITESDKTKEYLGISRNEVAKLSFLVDKVLNIAQVENEHANLKIEVLEISKIVKTVLHSMTVAINKKNAEFHVDIEEGLSLSGDKFHLTNVIYNLLDNALKYSATQPIISISGIIKSGFLEICISDNGKGISSEHLEYIFDKFYRIENHDRHEVKGHGLGLSYVKNIVNLHGGKIDVNSTIGRGSKFTIYLPAST